MALEYAVEEHRSLVEHDCRLQCGERRCGDPQSTHDGQVDAVELSTPDLDPGLGSWLAPHRHRHSNDGRRGRGQAVPVGGGLPGEDGLWSGPEQRGPEAAFGGEPVTCDEVDARVQPPPRSRPALDRALRDTGCDSLRDAHHTRLAGDELGEGDGGHEVSVRGNSSRAGPIGETRPLISKVGT